MPVLQDDHVERAHVGDRRHVEGLLQRRAAELGRTGELGGCRALCERGRRQNERESGEAPDGERDVGLGVHEVPLQMVFRGRAGRMDGLAGTPGQAPPRTPLATAGSARLGDPLLPLPIRPDRDALPPHPGLIDLERSGAVRPAVTRISAPARESHQGSRFVRRSSVRSSPGPRFLVRTTTPTCNESNAPNFEHKAGDRGRRSFVPSRTPREERSSTRRGAARPIDRPRRPTNHHWP